MHPSHGNLVRQSVQVKRALLRTDPHVDPVALGLRDERAEAHGSVIREAKMHDGRDSGLFDETEEPRRARHCRDDSHALAAVHLGHDCGRCDSLHEIGRREERLSRREKIAEGAEPPATEWSGRIEREYGEVGTSRCELQWTVEDEDVRRSRESIDDLLPRSDGDPSVRKGARDQERLVAYRASARVGAHETRYTLSARGAIPAPHEGHAKATLAEVSCARDGERGLPGSAERRAADRHHADILGPGEWSP
jgi:hypothetical protein